MKLSLRWIFDHIAASYDVLEPSLLMEKFNQAVAEMSEVRSVCLPVESLFIATVRTLSKEKDAVSCFIPELGRSIVLSTRSDIKKGYHYMVYYEGEMVRWARLSDFGGIRADLVPAIDLSARLLKGEWKKAVELVDHIIEIDNKSITHRPDLWCHRGIAREIAALFGLKFKPLKPFIKNITKVTVKDRALLPEFFREDKQICPRYGMARFEKVTIKPSSLAMVLRLARIEAKPINLIVDATNYVMFDIGHPLHAFDATYIEHKSIHVRKAKADEALTLLDGQTIALTENDIVVSADNEPIALAGVMGGKESAVHETTHTLLVESAVFDGASVRRTAGFYKRRTESAVRFEKGIDQETVINALERFYALLAQAKAIKGVNVLVWSTPHEAAHYAVELEHAYIEKTIGVAVPSAIVVDRLHSIGFNVQKKHNPLRYIITVPSWRGYKDVRIPADIVEEVARLWGFAHITPQLPQKTLKASPLPVLSDKKIQLKHHAAFGMRMQEVQNYALYDEHFLHTIGFSITGAVKLKNPLSENNRYLVTSLIPHMLKIWFDHKIVHDAVRLFEVNACWTHKEAFDVQEKEMASFLWWDKKGVDFYEQKASILSLFNAFGVSCTWVKGTDSSLYHPYESATLLSGEVIVGRFGILNKIYAPHESVLPCIAELDASFLYSGRQAVIMYQSLSKFPQSSFDISMLVDMGVTVDQIENAICAIDTRIHKVFLKDFFTNPAWKTQKALTFHCVVQDYTKTMTKDDIDALSGTIIDMLKQRFQVTIR